MSSSSSEISGTLLALSNNLADAVEQAGRAVVGVNARSRISSSGVHWRQDIVVTADHTIKRSEEITVTLPDSRAVSATLVGRDDRTDLAVLKLEGANLPTADIGDTASLKVGHLVLAVGLRGENGLSASFGVVSALGGSGRSWYGGLIDQFIRLDLTLYHGMDGGSLVDATGRVVGINTSGPRGMALAIPTATVNQMVDQLLEKGRIARGYLGLGMQPVVLPERLRRELSLLTAGGVIVVNVEPQGPADRVGVLIGDVLVAMDGKPINHMGDVQVVLDPESVGRTIKMQLIRGGTLVEVAIAPGERPWQEE